MSVPCQIRYSSANVPVGDHPPGFEFCEVVGSAFGIGQREHLTRRSNRSAGGNEVSASAMDLARRVCRRESPWMSRSRVAISVQRLDCARARLDIAPLRDEVVIDHD